ncbi:hypothetical protein AB0G15_08475 [Streptosporangium sp. NPDC023825]|uniref:hypothetical protein n=1 Tax=Streptosporangium sp. NPDC023825 TaxID=3154909 RepID=UPI003423ED4E
MQEFHHRDTTFSPMAVKNDGRLEFDDGLSPPVLPAMNNERRGPATVHAISVSMEFPLISGTYG